VKAWRPAFASSRPLYALFLSTHFREKKVDERALMRIEHAAGAD
jgi:hypothetical protein